MTVETSRKYQTMTAFLVLAVLINATASVLSRHQFNGEANHLVPYAACFDMTVVVPALYYILVVRRGIQTIASLLLLILVCLVRAFFVAPTVIHGEFVLIGAEVGIIVLICLRIREGMRAAKDIPGTGDPLQQIVAACKAIIPVSQAAHFMASELAVFYYAFFSWRPRASRTDARTFTTHTKGGHASVLIVLACLMPIEAPILHVLLARWNKTAAWIFTALGIYGFLWTIGLARSLMLRPVVVADSGLEMNKGFLWLVRAPWSDILAVKRVGATASVSSPGFLNLAVGGTPDFVVDLAQPVTAQGPFGIRKRVTAIGLSIDEAQDFQKSLDSKLLLTRQ